MPGSDGKGGGGVELDPFKKDKGEPWKGLKQSSSSLS